VFLIPEPQRLSKLEDICGEAVTKSNVSFPSRSVHDRSTVGCRGGAWLLKVLFIPEPQHFGMLGGCSGEALTSLQSFNCQAAALRYFEGCQIIEASLAAFKFSHCQAAVFLKFEAAVVSYA
jgi:hypothetical protein